MKINRILTAIMITVLIASGSVFAGGATISATKFMELMKADKSLIVIDANTAKTYKNTHVKNAISIPHKELYKEGTIDGLIKSPQDLAKYFGSKGISNTATIVVYDNGSNKYSSRVFWVLKYLGAKNVMILHKDMDAFKKARVPLTSAVPSKKAVVFTLNVKKAYMATTSYVKENIKKANVVVVDNRKPAEFNGTSEKPASDGHLPGAININHEDLLSAKGAYKSKTELAAVAKRHGLTPEKEIIFYCRTSVRAGVGFVAFHEILGYPNVKVYDGAYLEWEKEGNPIVK